MMRDQRFLGPKSFKIAHFVASEKAKVERFQGSFGFVDVNRPRGVSGAVALSEANGLDSLEPGVFR
jgi:hypothetical protein